MDEHEIALNDAFYEIQNARRDAEQHESFTASRPMMRMRGVVADGFALQREESLLERAVRTGRRLGLPWSRVADALATSEDDARQAYGYVDQGGGDAPGDGAQHDPELARRSAEALAEIVMRGRHAWQNQPYRQQAMVDRAVADAILSGASWAQIAEALRMPEPEVRRLYG
jgi:hypothetical protein